MRVLLVNPPIREHEAPWYFPSGLGYVARSLRDAGHEVSVLEINAHRYPPDRVERLIRGLSYDVVGIGAMVTRYSYIKWLTPLLKARNPGAKVIVGGGIASSIPELLLGGTETDIACLGEGEVTARGLLRALEDSSDLEQVPGICYRRNGEMVRTAPREQVASLDDIPFPAYELFPMEIYLHHDTQSIVPLAAPNISMITSRGCPYRCTFCHRVIRGKTRFRSADNILAEVRMLKDSYGVKGIFFHDELTITNKRLTYELCDRLLAEGVGVEWACSVRANLVDRELMARMRQAGCVYVTYGIESGSQRMLDQMKKGTTVEQNREAWQVIRESGIACSPSFILGMPSETEETVRETVDFVAQAGIKPFTFFFATPYPGTELYEEARAMGRIADEESFIEELDDATKFVVNLTALSDDELVRLKKEAELAIIRGYFRTHRWQLVALYLGNTARVPGELWRYYRAYGVKSTVRRLWGFLSALFR